MLTAADITGRRQVDRVHQEGDHRDMEWAGVTFDPSGRWMFVNIQTPGVTFAITGPWEKGLL